jgi:DNA-binding transcriptional regulator LsrR (DeoR family)
MARRVDLRLISKVSKLYYHQNLTQQEIADKLHISRPKVSRLLQQALDEGIVQITVFTPLGSHADLEEQLESLFRLKEAIVVDVVDPNNPEVVSRELGSVAAGYFQRTLRDGDIIGLSWGKTLNAMVNSIQPQETKGIHVVQMIGGIDMPEIEVHATSLSRRLAQLIGSSLSLLHAPGIVDNQETRLALLSDSHMQRVLELYDRINVAYVGIGTPNQGSFLRTHNVILSDESLDYLTSLGAVGDIALRFFDQYGRPIQSDIDDRVIGIDVDQLRSIEHVVGVAGGPEKVHVIRGALWGDFIDVLITDSHTAELLVKEVNEREIEIRAP